MQTTLVMTLLGPDRPGIVEQMASLVRAHDGNWLESRLAHLAGQFAGIVKLSLPTDSEPAFRLALENLEETSGLRCVVAGGEADPGPGGCLHHLELVGQDRPGIVHAITEVLAGFQANVEQFESACVSAPMSGENLFQAQLIVRLPEGVDLEALESRLMDIGDELMLDLSLRD